MVDCQCKGWEWRARTERGRVARTRGTGTNARMRPATKPTRSNTAVRLVRELKAQPNGSHSCRLCVGQLCRLIAKLLLGGAWVKVDGLVGGRHVSHDSLSSTSSHSSCLLFATQNTFHSTEYNHRCLTKPPVCNREV